MPDVTDFVCSWPMTSIGRKAHPGSIAGQSWFEKTLDKRMRSLDPDHTIVAIGSYGYDWVEGRSTP